MAIKEFKNATDLKSTHEKYNANIANWIFWWQAYDGGEEFIKAVLFKNERETFGNYKTRLKEAINLNYAGSIIDLFNFYLTEKRGTRACPKLADNKQWKMFLRDANLKGMDYNVFLDESQKLASIYGHIGVLVDKPQGSRQNIDQEIKDKVYPYVCAYTPQNVLDWEFEINSVTGREELCFLKLLMDNGVYYIWTKEKWEKWEIAEKNAVKKIDHGANPLGKIPFLWMANIQSIHGAFGSKSDIKDVSKIVGSITRNISCGDEIIKFAGFPIYRKPMDREEDDLSAGEETDSEGSESVVVVGQGSVAEFDPEYGEHGKPDWMETEIAEPIEAILGWTDRKVDEIFRVCHLSGVHGQRKSNNEVASGLALRYEFQQLHSVMNKKSNAMTEADYLICYYWMCWQSIDNIYDELEITRPKNFSIDELAVSLDTVITAMKNVISKTFRQEAQKKIVKQELPDLPQKTYDLICSEIEIGTSDSKPDPETVPDENSQTKDKGDTE